MKSDSPRIPVLWHLPHSHYSEKARWALAWKGVEHVRRVPPPGAHMAVAAWLTRGTQMTLPVLELDGERIGDSTAIIGALEARRPDPALYPDDPAVRRRALDLEDFFDEGLGPAARLFAFHHARGDRERLGELALRLMPAPVRRLPGARAGAAQFAATFTSVRFGVASDEAEAAARETILAACDRLESELDGAEHLAGDSFSVADLTAAALLYPLVVPREGPSIFTGLPDSAQPFLDQLRPRPAWAWTEQTYARFRRGAPVGAA
jgi:glutathione S-transferase